MNKKKKHTCNRFRVLGNVGMIAGFFVLCVALEVGMMAEKAAVSEGLAAAQMGGMEAGLEAAAVAGGSLLYSLNWFLPRAGFLLMAGGFVSKLLFWRCPQCGCHLTLCARGDGRECPCCGAALEERGGEESSDGMRPGGNGVGFS